MRDWMASDLEHGFNAPEAGFVWSTFRFGMRFEETAPLVLLSVYYGHDEGILRCHGRLSGGRRFPLRRGMNKLVLACGAGDRTFEFEVSPRRALAEDVRELGVMVCGVEGVAAAPEAEAGAPDGWRPAARPPAAQALARHVLESFIAPGIFMPYLKRGETGAVLELSLYLPPGERGGTAMLAPVSINGTLHEIELRQEPKEAPADSLPHLPEGRYRGWMSLRDYDGGGGDPVDLDIFYADAAGQERFAGQSAHWRGQGSGTVPSAANIFRVAGAAPEDFFLFSGATWCVKMMRLYETLSGKPFETCGKILDWGIGCGRIARFFPAAVRERVHGVDIDALNIEWCRENLPGIAVQTTAPAPPLPFADAMFEIVFGHSVMTHLSEADQHAWLAELARVTQPGGYCLLTVLNEVSWFIRFFPAQRSPDNVAEYLDAGFVDDGSLDVGVDKAQPGVYRNVSHTSRYIRQTWSNYFEILNIIHAFADMQSLVVMRRKGSK